MRKHMISLVLGVVCMCCGCTEKSVPAFSDTRAQAAHNKILQIRKELAEGRWECGRRDDRWSLSALVSEVTDVNVRVELARMYASTVLGVDFVKMTCQQKEESVRCYFDHVTSLIRIMRLAALSPKIIIEVYFKGMEKFRVACLDVSLAAKSKDESPIDYRWRRDCALKLYGEYAQRISEIKRFWLPRLEDYLPDEVHDEFRSRIEPFFEFPTLQEFRRAPIFSGEGVHKIVSPVMQSK